MKNPTKKTSKISKSVVQHNPALMDAFKDILKMFDWSDSITDLESMHDEEIVDFITAQQENKTEKFLDEDFTIYNGKLRGLKLDTVLTLKKYNIPTPDAWNDVVAALQNEVAEKKSVEVADEAVKEDETVKEDEGAEGDEAVKEDEVVTDNEVVEGDEEQLEKTSGQKEKMAQTKKNRAPVRGTSKIARMFYVLSEHLKSGIARGDAIKLVTSKVPDISLATVKIQLQRATKVPPHSFGKLIVKKGDKYFLA